MRLPRRWWVAKKPKPKRGMKKKVSAAQTNTPIDTSEVAPRKLQPTMRREFKMRSTSTRSAPSSECLMR